MAHRLAAPLVRHVLEQFRTRQLNARQAAHALGVSRRRLDELQHHYRQAYAHGQHPHWTPGVSGGDHAAPWPEPVVALLRKRLGAKPPASYSFAASEALRVCGFTLHRAQVRRWASGAGLAHDEPVVKVPAPMRRWQRSRIGELWQLDGSPHRWFADVARQFPLLNLLDDCSRLHVGTRLYERELLLA